MGLRLAISFTALLLALIYKSRQKTSLPLPPGPPATPLLGHLRHLLTRDQHLVFYELGKTYGDVIYLHALGRSIVILNSAQAAIDLLEKRGPNYSDRTVVTTISLLGWDNQYTLSAMPYGKQFQLHRRMVQEYIMEKKSISYRPIQTAEARIFLQSLLADDGAREESIHRWIQFIASTMIRILFGHQVTSNDDVYVKIAHETSHVLSNAGPLGATPVDVLPFLQYFPSWFPGTYYATYARKHRHVADKVIIILSMRYRNRWYAEGSAESSFLSYHMECLERAGENHWATEEDIKGAAATLYLGSADTTASSLSIFFLAMVLHPECQARAQEEIDAVVGSGRLPDFGDKGSLPYIDALVWETLRWNSAVPLGIPHRCMENDVYRGMLIPKGSIVIANTRGMTLDDKIYTDPHTFNPSRYLPKPDGYSEPYPSGPFGFGRRVCPGRHIAEASLWIAIASVLGTLKITKALGSDGKEITPEVAFDTGIGSTPRPYQCRIQPRSEAARRLISQAYTFSDY